MTLILIGATISVIVGLVGTRLYAALARRRSWGQFVRVDGPTSHHSKRGTPQMGGIAIIATTLIAYVGAHLATWSAPTVSGLLVLMLMLGAGFIGFLDDFSKIRKEQSEGLTSRQKLAGQIAVAVVFALLATRFARDGLTPASFRISVVRDTALDLAAFGTVIGLVLFIAWATLMIAAASNAVNLTDGLDGQATGASVMVFIALSLIGVWQWLNSCTIAAAAGCYEVRDPLDLALVAACIAGACIGFLWWNAPPAKLFMGDTGSLALGAALAGIAIMSRTELLMIVLGGLFVLETVAVIIQVGVFKATKRRNGGVGRRVFRMTPIHHHFELLGWSQVTVAIRFWIIAAVCVSAGLGIFYGEWLLAAG